LISFYSALHLVYRKNSQLMMCKVKAVRSEIHTKHIMHCEHHLEFFSVKN